jgi:hypothetical protein
MRFTLAALLIVVATPAFAANDKTQANSYDDAWENAWVQHCRTILSGGSGKTAGFVLQIGDSITHSNPNAQWPRYGSGKTSEDSTQCNWIQAPTWGSGTTDVASKNGYYLAAADTSGVRGMTAASGIAASEMLVGSGNGGTAMPSDTNTSTAKVKIADATYDRDIHIDTLAAAFADAQIAVLMLGTNDANGSRTANAFIADLTAIVDKLEARHIVVVLSTIPPMTTSGSTLVDPYNSAIKNFAQTRGLPLIDFNAEILARKPGSTWQNTLISSDGVHPSASGGASYGAASDPYADGGNSSTHTTGPACSEVGYLLRSWLTVQKLKEVKNYVIDGNNPPSAPTIASITVTPAGATITAGGTQQFSAVAKDSGGNALASQPSFTWSVSSGGGSINASGNLTAASTPGSNFTVTASASNVSGNATFSIVAATISSITVSPSSTSVVAGGTKQFSAVAKDSGGNALASQPTFTWSVSTGGGSINASGLLTAATTAGSNFTVTASAGGKNGTASFSITATGTVSSITLSPASVTLSPLATQQFTATVKDEFGNTISPTPTLTWQVLAGGSVDATGLLTAGSNAGTNAITASASGKSNSANFTVVIPNNPPEWVSRPTATPNPAAPGEEISFSAIASDADNDALTYAWTFQDGTTAQGASVKHTYTVAGTYRVLLRVTDARGAITNGGVQVTVGSGSSSSSNTAHQALNVVKLGGTMQTTGGRDGCKFSGTFPALPSGFDTTAMSAEILFGSVSFPLTLNSKGMGKSANANLALKLKPSIRDKATKKIVFTGGDVAFKASISHASLGLDVTALLASGTAELPISVILGGTVYDARVSVSVAKAGKGGKFFK